MDRPKRTCCGCGWAAVVVVVVTPRTKIEDKRDGMMKRKVMVDTCRRVPGILSNYERLLAHK